MIHRFNDYVLNLERRELRRAGMLLKLEPKALQILAYLVQHRHRLVSKQELLERVWPKICKIWEIWGHHT